jgi:hypothetical protein
MPNVLEKEQWGRSMLRMPGFFLQSRQPWNESKSPRFMKNDVIPGHLPNGIL